MLSTTLIYLIIFFISIQKNFGHFTFVKKDFSTDSHNTTNPAKTCQLRTGRTKRSMYDVMLPILKMTIQFEGGSIITATLTKQQPILANEYLPVISSQVNLFRNVMNDVGEFVMYHDVEHCIAIVYLGKYRKFYGVISLHHHIADLPFNFDANGIYRSGLVGKPYVKKNYYEFFHSNPNENYPPPSDIDAWEDFLRPSGYSPAEAQPVDPRELWPSTSRQLNEENTQTHHGCSECSSNITPTFTKMWTNRPYYVETLVLVTHDLANIFKEKFGEEEYVAAIVRYHIILFNGVNMLLNGLKSHYAELFGVTINIAKIVIEGGSTSFGFEDGDGLQFSDVITKLPLFFHNHKNSYIQDSFDYVFVHTRRPIMDGNILVDAISKFGLDMIEGRKTRKYYETVPITAARLKNFYAHYAVVAHEISRTLGVKITPKEIGLKPIGQCINIMQRGGPKCYICLAWTRENVYQILRFFSNNRNRCFLLNEPRSLHPPIVIRGLTANSQCRCLGYQSYIKKPRQRVQSYVRNDGCSTPLQCLNVSRRQIFYEGTILPFDGTLCSKEKVCWNEKCEKIGSSV